MSKFDMGWRDNLRMKHGLHWKKHRPTFQDIERGTDWLLAIIVAIAITLLFAYLDERDARIAAQIEDTKASSEFAAFLNGGILTNPEQTFAAKCEHLVTVTMEKVK